MAVGPWVGEPEERSAAAPSSSHSHRPSERSFATFHARIRLRAVASDTPSTRERRLARELRLLRELAQLHGKDVAERLGWSAAKVSRIETGRSGISADDLEGLLDLYRVPDPQATYLRRLAPSARARGWWDAYADTLSSGYANLIRLEAGSQALRCYAALVPHALLQSPDYDRAIILATWEALAQAEVDRRVQACRRRQDVLDAGPQPTGKELRGCLRCGVGGGRSGLCRGPALVGGRWGQALGAVGSSL